MKIKKRYIKLSVNPEPSATYPITEEMSTSVYKLEEYLKEREKYPFWPFDMIYGVGQWVKLEEISEYMYRKILNKSNL
jgi:hypothetical protein